MLNSEVSTERLKVIFAAMLHIGNTSAFGQDGIELIKNKMNAKQKLHIKIGFLFLNHFLYRSAVFYGGLLTYMM